MKTIIYWMRMMVFLSPLLSEAKPGGTYILTGQEKSISDIIKADMEQYPDLYKGELFSFYLAKFKNQNRIGKRKLAPGDTLVFPETEASKKAKDIAQIAERKKLLIGKWKNEAARWLFGGAEPISYTVMTTYDESGRFYTEKSFKELPDTFNVQSVGGVWELDTDSIRSKKGSESWVESKIILLTHNELHLQVEGESEVEKYTRIDVWDSLTPKKTSSIACPSEHLFIIKDDFNDGMIDPSWSCFSNGCIVAESNGTLSIRGITQLSGWEHDNGVTTEFTRLGETDDFEVSVDFVIPEFLGSGTRLVYLAGHAENGGKFGLFYSCGKGYRVQTWDPRGFSDWLRPIGNETSVFHTMKLTYISEHHNLKGYVDGEYVGELTAPLSGDLSLSVFVTSKASEMKIGALFDNFSAMSGEANHQK